MTSLRRYLHTPDHATLTLLHILLPILLPLILLVNLLDSILTYISSTLSLQSPHIHHLGPASSRIALVIAFFVDLVVVHEDCAYDAVDWLVFAHFDRGFLFKWLLGKLM